MALPGVLAAIRPRPRWTETRLLALVALALIVGSVSLGLTVTGDFGPYDPRGLLIYLAALGIAHLAQILAGRRSDQILLPVVGMLGGISLLLMQRLPQGLVTLDVGSTDARPGGRPAGVAGPRHRGRDDPRRSSSAPTAGCVATSTRGRRSGSGSCC